MKKKLAWHLPREATIECFDEKLVIVVFTKLQGGTGFPDNKWELTDVDGSVRGKISISKDGIVTTEPAELKKEKEGFELT